MNRIATCRPTAEPITSVAWAPHEYREGEWLVVVQCDRRYLWGTIATTAERDALVRSIGGSLFDVRIEKCGWHSWLSFLSCNAFEALEKWVAIYEVRA